jgi:transcription-repair coupling factor (superfamily II helicase)
LAPEPSLLTPEARRRLTAIETFSELGSGFNIAMQDLDIRGAGNMLGAEQSGFIADLGYETYQRILNEAVHELKDEEFSELYAEEIAKENSSLNYVTDCQIDTDMELMFSSDYIENVSERITLYRELDSIDNEADLLEFEKRIEDRFGKIPDQSKNLLLVVRLRWLAIKYGIERLVLKNERMTAFLVTNPLSSYYQSENFGKILQFVATHPRQCQLRDQQNRRSVVVSMVRTINQAYHILSEIDGKAG